MVKGIHSAAPDEGGRWIALGSIALMVCGLFVVIAGLQHQPLPNDKAPTLLSAPAREPVGAVAKTVPAPTDSADDTTAGPATHASGTAPLRPRSINQTGHWLAPDQRQGFADLRDFTGGREPLFTTVEWFSPESAPRPTPPSVTLRRGESLANALDRAGLSRADRNAAIAALADRLDLRRLRPGLEVTVILHDRALTPFEDVALNARGQRPAPVLSSLSLRTDPLTRTTATRRTDGSFSSATVTTETTTHHVAISGQISDNLFSSAEAAGAPREVVAKLANLFLFDIDFQREIHAGDHFEAVYEVLYDEQGIAVAYGDVVFGQLSWRGNREEKDYYRFDDGQTVEWFDRHGRSARRLLMKTPIEGARITSSFGNRRHPVLGYTRKHKGVDFGAARGTPIMAAGNGTVLRANRFGSFGNYVRIRHANGYETAYAHLNGFATGIRKGAKVRQGDIIGYVGTTGRSTGPHLHYEVIHNGRQVNPMTIKLATGRVLGGDALAAFQIERASIDRLRRPTLLVEAE